MSFFPAKYWTRAVATTVLSAIVCSQSAVAAPDDEPVDPVDRAIKKGVAYLYSVQKDSNWEVVPRRSMEEGHQVAGAQWGGLSSMAVYGLLAAGENPQSPKLAAAIDWLNKADVVGTYAMGMKLQMWNYIEKPSPAMKDVLRKDATLLLNGVKTGANNMGLYHYWVDPTKGDYDHSTSNYGVLGMWAAAQQNLEVPEAYWKLIDAAWRKGQLKDGAWAYKREANDAHPGTMSLTPAGVATLFITQDMLNNHKGECKGNIVDKDIERGIEWMSKNYAKTGNNLYALYNVERVGTASGHKYFGTVDWYEDGVNKLLKSQAANGSWAGGHGGSVPGTVWAILFLVKGRAPVMMNKLDYAIDTRGDKGGANWNQRPRDIANLARWAGKALEKELNWQIVNLKVDIEDFHDSPVLYVSGNQALTFKPEEKAKLKQFVEGGGLILGHSDCLSSAFNASFSKLGAELFGGEFRDLPADHLIYSCHFKRKTWPPAFNPALKGLTNGARELMVLIPAGDPARYWQIQNFSGVQVKPWAELASNIYLYAADKATLKSRFKGQPYVVKKDEKVKADRSVKIARLDYGGNWNPEPGGWRRFENVMHNKRKIDLQVEPVKLGTGALKPGEFQVAHLTGTNKFTLNPAAIAELSAFVNGGGTLVIDAAGGQVDFKDAAEAALTKILNDPKPLSPLPADHALYAAGGTKLDRVSYRYFAQAMLPGGSKAIPRVRGAQVNGRMAVYYSPEDLSVGLVGMNMDGIYGYSPESATAVMERIVLAAATGGGAPAKVAGPAADAGAGDAVPAADKTAPAKSEPAKTAPKPAAATPAKRPAAATPVKAK
ncbi:MAG TPA: DUF4159 domain-containing protein [Tepidisphaeraceae bacterium]|nr:DUF4159 domain-containing protein [Tepidisphaeraceae bacterium]